MGCRRRPGLTAADFPHGFAETDHYPLLDRRDERIRQTDPSWPGTPRGLDAPLLFDLEYGEIFDAGIAHYGEFFASLDYAWELLERQTAPWDDGPGRLAVAARFKNAIQLKWKPAS